MVAGDMGQVLPQASSQVVVSGQMLPHGTYSPCQEFEPDRLLSLEERGETTRDKLRPLRQRKGNRKAVLVQMTGKKVGKERVSMQGDPSYLCLLELSQS